MLNTVQVHYCPQTSSIRRHRMATLIEVFVTWRLDLPPERAFRQDAAGNGLRAGAIAGLCQKAQVSPDCLTGTGEAV